MACINYLSLTINMHTGSRRYSSIIGEASVDTIRVNLVMHLESIVARKSVSHHHHCSVWQGEPGRGHPELQGKLRQTE